MRNLLAFLAAAALTFAGLGWYLDWYKIQSTPTTAGRHSIQIDINSKKITEDVHRGVKKGEEKLENVLDKERPSTGSPTSDASKTEPALSIPRSQAPPTITNYLEQGPRQTEVLTLPPGVGGL